MEPATLFSEIHGRLEPGPDRPRLTCDTVMLTNIDSGSALSRPASGLIVRYVGRGEEGYRIGGRFYRLSEGQFMVAQQNDGAEIEVRRSVLGGTLGLCAFLAVSEPGGELERPVVIPATCSSVGRVMHNRLNDLIKYSSNRPGSAAELVNALRAEVPKFLGDLSTQSERITAARSQTRLNVVHRINEARSYLHSITDRPVGLDELAAAAGMSRFHLLRSFRQAIGQSPASYHRRLRLELAMSEARRRCVSLGAIADDYGFAGVSGLSHAYKRAFGCSPVWRKNTRR